MNRRKIITFAVLAYFISWSIWLPNVFANYSGQYQKHSDWLHLLGGLGPVTAAILTTVFFDGKAGLRNYLSRRLFGFPKIKWILLGLGMPIVFFGIAFLIDGLSGGEWLDWRFLGRNAKIPFQNALIIWLIWCFFFGLGEEGGWRGLLFPEFSRGMGARTAAMLVALIWAGWHLPVFFYDKDLGSMGPGAIMGWTIGLACGSILLCWLVTQAKGSLLPAILWHGTFNFFTAGDQISGLIPGIMSAAVMLTAGWLAVRYGKRLQRA